MILVACLILAGGMLLTRMCRREYVPVNEDPQKREFLRRLWLDILKSTFDQGGGVTALSAGGGDAQGVSPYDGPDSLYSPSPNYPVDSTSVLTPPERPVPPPVPKPEPKPPKTR